MLLKCIMKMTDRLHLRSLAKCALCSDDVKKKKKKFAGLNPREFNHPRDVYLHPGLRQVDFHRQFFPSEHIGVVGLSKNRFQCFELLEGRRAEVSRAALEARGSCPSGRREFGTEPGKARLGSVRGRAPTCCRVKVVRLRRCFLRRKPSSKSPAECAPKGAAPAGGEPQWGRGADGGAIPACRPQHTFLRSERQPASQKG